MVGLQKELGLRAPGWKGALHKPYFNNSIQVARAYWVGTRRRQNTFDRIHLNAVATGENTTLNKLRCFVAFRASRAPVVTFWLLLLARESIDYFVARLNHRKSNCCFSAHMCTPSLRSASSFEGILYAARQLPFPSAVPASMISQVCSEYLCLAVGSSRCSNGHACSCSEVQFVQGSVTLKVSMARAPTRPNFRQSTHIVRVDGLERSLVGEVCSHQL
jgi:hypothetical protein